MIFQWTLRGNQGLNRPYIRLHRFEISISFDPFSYTVWHCFYFPIEGTFRNFSQVLSWYLPKAMAFWLRTALQVCWELEIAWGSTVRSIHRSSLKRWKKCWLRRGGWRHLWKSGQERLKPQAGIQKIRKETKHQQIHANSIWISELPVTSVSSCFQDSATLAAAGLMAYLTSSLLSERLLPMALWSVLDGASKAGQTGPTPRMVLDATALAAIEVVETLEGPAKWWELRKSGENEWKWRNIDIYYIYIICMDEHEWKTGVPKTNISGF